MLVIQPSPSFLGALLTPRSAGVPRRTGSRLTVRGSSRPSACFAAFVTADSGAAGLCEGIMSFSMPC
eukprot:3099108-Rhodomonas_salina.2